MIANREMNQFYTYSPIYFTRFSSVSKTWLMHDKARTMICFTGRPKLGREYKFG